MVIISCQCGEVAIQFPSQTPRIVVTCCCTDCQKRVSVMEAKGGKKLVEANSGITDWFIENTFHFLKGRDMLQFYKLTSEGETINMASTCCSTFLCVRNAEYHGNVVSVFPEYCGEVSDLNKEQLEAMKSHFVSFPSEWPRKFEITPPDKPQLWLKEDKSGMHGTEGFEAVLDTLTKTLNEPYTETAKGETLEAIIKSTSAIIKVIDGSDT